MAQYDVSIIGSCMSCGKLLREYDEYTNISFSDGARPIAGMYCKRKGCAPSAENKGKEDARVTLSDIPMMAAQYNEELKTTSYMENDLIALLTRDYHAHLLSIATVGNLPAQPTKSGDDGWISVHDMMPEPKKRVLVWHEGMGSADAGAWWPAEQRVPAAWYDDTGERYSDGKVTHWQPLPGKPKGLEE